MSAIQSRIAPVASKALEVLWTPRRDIRREHIRSGIVHVVTPRPGRLELQAVREASRHLRLQTVIPRPTIGHESNDVGTVKSRSIVRGDYARVRVDLVKGGRQAIERGLRWCREVHRKEQARGRLCLPIDSLLDRQMNSPSPNVANFNGVFVSENVLDSQIPTFRIRQLLVRDVP